MADLFDSSEPKSAAPEAPRPLADRLRPKSLSEVIGQEHAVEVIKKAATQRRHVMMIGSPGTADSCPLNVSNSLT